MSSYADLFYLMYLVIYDDTLFHILTGLAGIGYCSFLYKLFNQTKQSGTFPSPLPLDETSFEPSLKIDNDINNNNIHGYDDEKIDFSKDLPVVPYTEPFTIQAIPVVTSMITRTTAVQHISPKKTKIFAASKQICFATSLHPLLYISYPFQQIVYFSDFIDYLNPNIDAITKLLIVKQVCSNSNYVKRSLQNFAENRDKIVKNAYIKKHGLNLSLWHYTVNTIEQRNALIATKKNIIFVCCESLKKCTSCKQNKYLYEFVDALLEMYTHFPNFIYCIDSTPNNNTISIEYYANGIKRNPFKVFTRNARNIDFNACIKHENQELNLLRWQNEHLNKESKYSLRQLRTMKKKTVTSLNLLLLKKQKS